MEDFVRGIPLKIVDLKRDTGQRLASTRESRLLVQPWLSLGVSLDAGNMISVIQPNVLLSFQTHSVSNVAS